MNFIALRAAERLPWANGGGVKQNLLKTPHVQISIAQITQDGPFSYLPDQRRFFAVLKGAGVRLGTPPQLFDCDSPVWEFEGETAPDCRLVSGPTEDLNLMVQRSSISGAMQKHTVDLKGIATNFRAGAGILAIYLCGPARLTSLEQSALSLPISEAGLCWQAGSASPRQWQITPLSGTEKLTIFTIEGLTK